MLMSILQITATPSRSLLPDLTNPEEPASKLETSTEDCHHHQRPGECVTTCLYTVIRSTQVISLSQTTAAVTSATTMNTDDKSRREVTAVSMYRGRRPQQQAPNIQATTAVLSLPFQSAIQLQGPNVDTKCQCLQSLLKRERIYLTQDEWQRYGTYLQWVCYCRNTHSSSTKGTLQTEETDIFADRLLERSAAGDIREVARLLQTGVTADVQNEHGWTALMFAAKNGHSRIIDMLLEKGCKSELQTKGGQTAADIAKLWDQSRIAGLLGANSDVSSLSREKSVLSKTSIPQLKIESSKNISRHNILQRTTEKRKDVLWLDTMLKDHFTKFILFSDLQVFVSVKNGTKKNGNPHHQLVTPSYKDIDFYLEGKPLTLFLGVELVEQKGEQRPKERAWFAVDATSMDKEKLRTILPRGHFVSPFPAFLELNALEKSVFSAACSLMAWHRQHQFCPSCGSNTAPEDAGSKRTCKNAQCTSRSGLFNTNYPRLDPSVIMLVVSFSRTHCLLGRKKNFPSDMWFCLSGYLEPGESIEDACQREISEQVHLEVANTNYHSSLPWPYPTVLLIGCIVQVMTQDFKVNKEELKDAQWFSWSDMGLMSSGQHPASYKLPPEQTLSYRLIEWWMQSNQSMSDSQHHIC